MNNKTHQPVVTLKDVSKKYILHHEKPTITDKLFYSEEFWALKNINLTINAGEKIGIIGPNGAGKSTLLKIITGITFPTTGSITTKGKIASLIDLEAGFHPDLTGIENIFINGLLVGMSKKQIEKNLLKIINFADIGKFINSPLHTYSSGMKLRLGFSTAIYSNPDILIIDEVINAGDEKFRKKSLNKMQDFFKQHKTIIFVSHSLQLLKKICPQTIWLKNGKIKMIGPSQKVISQYK